MFVVVCVCFCWLCVLCLCLFGCVSWIVVFVRRFVVVSCDLRWSWLWLVLLMASFRFIRLHFVFYVSDFFLILV